MIFKLLFSAAAFLFSLQHCLSEVTVVFQTDNKYVTPTAVAMHSLLEHNRGYVTNVIIMSDGVSAEGHAALTKIAESEGTKISFLCLSQLPPEMVNEADMRAKGKKWHRLTYLRMRYPEIFIEHAGRLGMPNIKTFLHMDSDTVVMKTIKPLYEECLKTGQPIVGANLWFFSDGILSGGVGSIDSRRINARRSHWVVKGKDRYIDFLTRVSAGVTFFNLEIFQELKNKHEDFKLDIGAYLGEGMEEECGYGELLKWWALPMEKKVYFFSPVWNFRPDDLMKLGAYASEGEDLTTDKLIQDVRGRLSCDEEMFGDGTVKALKDIKSRQIAIYHWDQLPKPWEEGSYKSEAWEHWHHHHNAISGFPFK